MEVEVVLGGSESFLFFYEEFKRIFCEMRVKYEQ